MASNFVIRLPSQVKEQLSNLEADKNTSQLVREIIEAQLDADAHLPPKVLMIPRIGKNNSSLSFYIDEELRNRLEDYCLKSYEKGFLGSYIKDAIYSYLNKNKSLNGTFSDLQRSNNGEI